MAGFGYGDCYEESDSDSSYYSDSNGSSEYNFNVSNKGYVHVWTDGCCFGNGQYGAKAGIGVYFGEDHELNVSEPVAGRATNNCAEIQAATRAVEIALSVGVDTLCINTDSKFLINAAKKWISVWKENNWRRTNGAPLKNRKDFKRLDRAMQYLIVIWNYIPAHQGNFENEKADQLARDGAASRRQLSIHTRRLVCGNGLLGLRAGFFATFMLVIFVTFSKFIVC